MVRVKSFVGKNQKEVMEKVKAEFGINAVIVSTRKIAQKGFWGFFKPPMVEMTAVVDDRLAAEKQENVIREKQEVQAFMKETLRNEKLDRLEKQVGQLQNLIMSMHKDVDSIKYNELKSFSPELQAIYNQLIKSNVDNNNCIEILKRAEELIEKESLSPLQAVKKVISSFIGEPAANSFDDKKKKTIIFLGPTGVGKTTTLAKIAANLKIENDLNVGLVTQDTYRIGAVEQLKIYAEILNVPLKVIYSPEEITQVLADLDGTDVVLIDTAGRSPCDAAHLEEIKKLLQICDIDEVYLFVSATTGAEVALKIFQNYSFLKDYKLVITKLDEIENPGVILNIKMMTSKPIVYLSNGQRVPEDLEVPDPNLIINQIMGCDEHG